MPGGAWALQRALVGHLKTVWREPDEGIWEARDGRRCFTYSKAMAWAALDRTMHGIEMFGMQGPLAAGERCGRKSMMRSPGYDPARGSFVRSYGARAVDASLLLLPAIGFLPPEDPRIRGTIAAVERDLLEDGLVRRHRPAEVQDSACGRLLPLQFLVRRCVCADQPRTEGPRPVRAAARLAQGCRAAVGGTRPPHLSHAGQFSAGLLACRVADTAYILAHSGEQPRPVHAGSDVDPGDWADQYRQPWAAPTISNKEPQVNGTT